MLEHSVKKNQFGVWDAEAEFVSQHCSNKTDKDLPWAQGSKMESEHVKQFVVSGDPVLTPSQYSKKHFSLI